MGLHFYLCQMDIDVNSIARECVQCVKLLFYNSKLEDGTFFHASAFLKFAVLNVQKKVFRLDNGSQHIENIAECYSNLKKRTSATKSNKSQMETVCSDS